MKLCVLFSRILISLYVYWNYHTFHSIGNLTTPEFFSIVIIYCTSENRLMMNLNVNMYRRYTEDFSVFEIMNINWSYMKSKIMHEKMNKFILIFVHYMIIIWLRFHITIIFFQIMVREDILKKSFFFLKNSIFLKKKIIMKIFVSSHYEQKLSRFVWDGDSFL